MPTASLTPTTTPAATQMSRSQSEGQGDSCFGVLHRMAGLTALGASGMAGSPFGLRPSVGEAPFAAFRVVPGRQGGGGELGSLQRWRQIQGCNVVEGKQESERCARCLCGNSCLSRRQRRPANTARPPLHCAQTHTNCTALGFRALNLRERRLTSYSVHKTRRSHTHTDTPAAVCPARLKKQATAAEPWLRALLLARLATTAGSLARPHTQRRMTR